MSRANQIVRRYGGTEVRDGEGQVDTAEQVLPCIHHSEVVVFSQHFIIL